MRNFQEDNLLWRILDLSNMLTHMGMHNTAHFLRYSISFAFPSLGISSLVADCEEFSSDLLHCMIGVENLSS